MSGRWRRGVDKTVVTVTVTVTVVSGCGLARHEQHVQAVWALYIFRILFFVLLFFAFRQRRRGRKRWSGRACC